MKCYERVETAANLIFLVKLVITNTNYSQYEYDGEYALDMVYKNI